MRSRLLPSPTRRGAFVYRIGMKALLLIGCLLVAGRAAAESCQVAGASLAFADAEAGKTLLASEDGFVRALSPFDRAARLKSDRDVDTGAYLRFVAAQARSWTAAE